MKILHLISQHPEQTGSGFYVQNMIKHCMAHGHKCHLIAGISGNKRPELTCLSETECTFIPFEKDELNFTIPGMSDVMPYPSSKFSTLTKEQLDNYNKVFEKTITEVVQRFSPDIIHSHHLWLATVAARNPGVGSFLPLFFDWFQHLQLLVFDHSQLFRMQFCLPSLFFLYLFAKEDY